MRRSGRSVQLCFGSLVLAAAAAAALTKRRNFSDFSTTNIEVGDLARTIRRKADFGEGRFLPLNKNP